MNLNPFSISRLIQALGYSWDGLRGAWGTQAAVRLEVAIFAVLAPLGAWLGRTGIERGLLIGVWILVIVVELINSGFEAVVDRIGTERHPLSKRAKDLGSAAVLMSVLNAAVVWGFLLLAR